jgi:hypothetical protein
MTGHSECRCVGLCSSSQKISWESLLRGVFGKDLHKATHLHAATDEGCYLSDGQGLPAQRLHETATEGQGTCVICGPCPGAYPIVPLSARYRVDSLLGPVGPGTHSHSSPLVADSKS